MLTSAGASFRLIEQKTFKRLVHPYTLFTVKGVISGKLRYKCRWCFENTPNKYNRCLNSTVLSFWWMAVSCQWHISYFYIYCHIWPKQMICILYSINPKWCIEAYKNISCNYSDPEIKWCNFIHIETWNWHNIKQDLINSFNFFCYIGYPNMK